MSLAIGLLIGVMVGVLLSRFIFKEKPVGSLRVDESDPDSGPYLFLELDRSGADAIYKQRYVRLRVELAISKALKDKKTFNETKWINKKPISFERSSGMAA